MLKIGLNGARGRMGQEIINAITHNSASYAVAFAKARVAPPNTTVVTAWPLTATCDAVIDFTTAQSSLEALAFCQLNLLPLVVGTTGFSSLEHEVFIEASKTIPILMAPNMSLSVNVLVKLAAIAAKLLRNFDIEISESHHRYKKDAPSGTALYLGQAVANARNLNFSEVACFNRHGKSDLVRPTDEIGFAVVRGGNVIGKHTLALLGDSEELSLTSEITSRYSFAMGALYAARFVSGAAPGLYNMDNVLKMFISD